MVRLPLDKFRLVRLLAQPRLISAPRLMQARHRLRQAAQEQLLILQQTLLVLVVMRLLFPVQRAAVTGLISVMPPVIVITAPKHSRAELILIWCRPLLIIPTNRATRSSELTLTNQFYPVRLSRVRLFRNSGRLLFSITTTQPAQPQLIQTPSGPH